MIWEEFVDAIQQLTYVIRNHQCKQWDLVTTLAQSLLDFTWEWQGLSLFLDQQLTNQIHWFLTDQDRISTANTLRELQVQRQLRLDYIYIVLIEFSTIFMVQLWSTSFLVQAFSLYCITLLWRGATISQINSLGRYKSASHTFGAVNLAVIHLNSHTSQFLTSQAGRSMVLGHVLMVHTSFSMHLSHGHYWTYPSLFMNSGPL